MSSNTTSVDTTTLPDTTTTPLPPTTTPTTTPTTEPTTTIPTTTQPTTTPTQAPTTTSTSTAPTAPASTQIITSIVSVQPTNGGTPTPSTVVVTQISTPSADSSTSSTRSGTAGGASTTPTSSSNNGGGGGLSSSGKIAIAVVIPIVAVALLVAAGLFFWRRRKQRKVNEDERRKEMEAYGFNPNHDPTLPVVGAVTNSDDENSGYRGWGNSTAAGTMSNRKASTTLSSGAGNPAAYSPGSPMTGTDASGEPLVGGAGVGAGAAMGAAAVAGASQHSRNTTMDSDTMGAGYAAGGMHRQQSHKGAGVHRGPSNASSTYSMGGQSHHSNDAPIPVNSNEQYYSDYYQQGPYDNPYGQEAVIRDNPARRNTRIERAPTFPNQGSSGVATNF